MLEFTHPFQPSGSASPVDRPAQWIGQHSGLASPADWLCEIRKPERFANALVAIQISIDDIQQQFLASALIGRSLAFLKHDRFQFRQR